MSFDRTAVKKPEDLIPDDELKDSSLADKYACHNFKNPTAIKCSDGITRRHAETSEIFDDLFEIKDKDNQYHINQYRIKDSCNKFIRPAFWYKGDQEHALDHCKSQIDYNDNEVHPQNVSEKWETAIETFKQIPPSCNSQSSNINDIIRNGYRFDELIFSRPILFDHFDDKERFHFWHGSTFKNSIFLKYITLSKSYFTGGSDSGVINFSNTYFFDQICMDNTIFTKFTDKLTGANFENAIFFEPVEWAYSIFKNVNFKNTIFYKDVYFADRGKSPDIISSFSYTYFSNATFHEKTYFSHCKFDNVSFERAIFKKEVYFEGSNLSNSTFKNCEFHDKAYFNVIKRGYQTNKCEFDNISFERGTFKKEAYFEGSDFKSENNFKNCIFHGISGFNKITYSEKIIFKETEFKDKLYLYGSQALAPQSKLNLNGIIAKDIYFSPPKRNEISYQKMYNFEGYMSSEEYDNKLKIKTNIVDIQGSDIKGTIFAKDFWNEQELNLNGTALKSLILSSSHINNAKNFLEKIPDLRGIKLDGELRITNINFDIVAKKVTKDNALDSAERWEALQHICQKQGQYQHELDFFARAMDARQLAEEESPIKRWIAKRYKFFSDYGRSITRPFWWGIFIWFLFGLFYYLMVIKYENLNLNSISLEIDPFLKSFILSAKNTFPFLPDDVFSRQHFKNGFYAPYKENYGLYSIIRTANVLSGLIFTFLTALGIRNWLRLR